MIYLCTGGMWFKSPCDDVYSKVLSNIYTYICTYIIIFKLLAVWSIYPMDKINWDKFNLIHLKFELLLIYSKNV